MAEQDAEKMYKVVTKEEAERVHPIEQPLKFLASVKQEMKLVNRPSWQVFRSTTLVVIAFVFLSGLYLYVLGWIFSHLDRWLFIR